MTCRGNERKAIFKDNRDKKVFLELLSDGLKTYHITLFCYVLMDNHFHLLLETPLANLFIPQEFFDFIAKINNSSVVTRYPEDFKMLITSYPEEIVMEYLENAEKVLKWLRQNEKLKQ